MDSFLGRLLASANGGISNTSAQYLRIAALTMATYDWLLTLPAEWRFYRSQANILRPSLACVLFFLIRYVSITVVIFSNVGNFATFSEAGCQRFFMAVPVTKCIQTIISQAILSVRTYALSKRSKPVGYLLAFMFVSFGFALAFVNIYARIPSMPNGQ
ncbi:hypothetical protein AURDEDRAFT_185811 [Auricularia subglabra TFB-10046 SS5]|nr:hypothetical protein AURDEDRAFT_185811 [Auricularia subglabra TFB-10046 SS5]